MRLAFCLLALIPLSACDMAGGDRSPLTQEELAARTPIGSIAFGDDGGDFANDGECDDPRFKGPGMTPTPLMEDDEMADASDCKTAYQNGELVLIK